VEGFTNRTLTASAEGYGESAEALARRRNPELLTLHLNHMDRSSNPWLDLSEADYDGHMNSPEVGQRPILDRILREALEDVRPRALLVLGGSTGHGLESVDGSVTSRVTVVDLNQTYLDRLVVRFANPQFSLDVQCADLAEATFDSNSFDLVHAALVLEYIEWPRLLPRLAPSLRADGVLSVVLQRPSLLTPAVTPTKFSSLSSLESVFRFVEAEMLVERAREVGLTIHQRRTVPLPGGKAFDVLRFSRDASGV